MGTILSLGDTHPIVFCLTVYLLLLDLVVTINKRHQPWTELPSQWGQGLPVFVISRSAVLPGEVVD